MIRINLLPHGKKTRHKSTPGQGSALVGLLAIAAAVVGCMLVNRSKQTEVDAISDQNNQIEAQIATIKSALGDVHALEAEKAELQAEAGAIQNLTQNRQLPCWAMHELSKLMTRDHEPSYQPQVYEALLKKSPSAAFDPTWDPKALWLTKFSEKDHAVEIDGGARSSDDIAEFVKRLGVSVYFQNPRTTTITKQSEPLFQGGPSVDYLAFIVTATVNY
jgi:Tfp pilus assembly protein PilN